MAVCTTGVANSPSWALAGSSACLRTGRWCMDNAHVMARRRHTKHHDVSCATLAAPTSPTNEGEAQANQQALVLTSTAFVPWGLLIKLVLLALVGHSA